jgi:hypothetical protein
MVYALTTVWTSKEIAMTTVNTIEQRILQMDGGEFQKLCDAYLSMIGYGKPNAFGSVASSNKVRKGTPDSFFERDNGKFVFAEYTTQRNDVCKKLSGDLNKCFNEKKTKVPIIKLEEIVICYTSQLEPSEVIFLKSKCEKKNVRLKLLGISALANDLLNHPVLLRNFLNLAIDTGQIIPLESFPSVYGKSKFATTLETKFHFRAKEIKEFSDALENYDLVVVSGKAGIGKSRFALEGCRNFITQHSEFDAYSIISLSQNLYEDLIERFSQPGQYLILVDDANRVINFSYFMHILRTHKDNQRIKIVVTVRDYALDKINSDILNYPHYSMQLERFSNDEIKELAKTEFEILNYLYLERIEAISGGNPRIAVMVSRVATEKNTLDSINDVSALYDEYFSSIKEDLQNFGETNLLKTAGIIAFLRAIDRTNEQMMSGIQQSFNILPDVFWSCAFRLHELEMVDMYEDEVVRISDQVLSTYLFYSAFFKEKVLDFSSILQNYFPNFRSKLIDALNPALNVFDRTAIFDTIRPKVHKIWEDLISTNDEEKLLALAESFWHLQQAKTLSFVKKRLEQSQYAPADLTQLDQLDENKINNVSITTELQLLGHFRYATPELRAIALETLVGYLNIRPAEILQVLHIFTDDYGFDRYSNYTDFSVQEMVIDLLWKNTENGQNELYSRLLIVTLREYAKIHFQTHESKSNMTIAIYDFVLQPKTELFQLRTKIFGYLINLYENYPKQVLDVFENYINGYHQAASDEIFSNDSVSLLGFVQTRLNPENYIHNIFANNYFDFLENHNVTFDNQFRKKFRNDTYAVYQLLSENRRDFRQYEYKEFTRIRKEHLTSYFSNFSGDEIKTFIDRCIEIESNFRQRHDRHEIISGFGMAMSVLAKSRSELYKTALSYYIQQGDKLSLHPIHLVQMFMGIYGKEKTFDFFSELDNPNKERWLFGFYQVLPAEEIEANDLYLVYELFQNADQTQMPDHLDFLLNYAKFDNRILSKVAKSILDKCETNYSAWILASITNPYSEIHKHLEMLFKDDIDILKKVYLTVKSAKDHDDHNSATLSKILDLDLEFIVEYIEWIYTPKDENSRWHRENQDYSLLWRNRNYRKIFSKIIDLIYRKEGSHHYYTELRQFFVCNEAKKVDADIEQKQEELFTDLIKEKCSDIDFIEYLFEVAAYFPQERRYRLIFTFLQCNKNLADFQRLAIEPRSMLLWSGSAVPMYQGQIDYLRSLLPMMNSSNLLEHQVYLLEMIDHLESRKTAEKKRDFMGTDL